MKIEKWKPIFNGRYEVSSYGRIRSWVCNRSKKLPIIMVGGETNKYGHRSVTLRFNGKAKSYSIHRLVLENFGPNKATYKHVCAHNDSNPKNNNITNLRWATQKENISDAVKRGSMVSPRQKLNWSVVNYLRKLNPSGSATKIIADKFNISTQNLRCILNYKTWREQCL